MADLVCGLRLLQVFGAHKVHVAAALFQGRKNRDTYLMVCAVEGLYAYAFGSQGGGGCKALLQNMGCQKTGEPLGIVWVYHVQFCTDFF